MWNRFNSSRQNSLHSQDKSQHRQPTPTAKHGRLQREIDDGLAKLQKQSASAAEKRVISRCGAGRHKVHVAIAVAGDALPSEWRTCCGLKFAFWTFTRHSERLPSPRTPCARNASAGGSLSCRCPARESSDAGSETGSSSSNS